MRVTFFAFLVFASPAAVFAADGTYEVTKTEVLGAVGSPAKTSVTVTAKQGWHLNHEAPFTLKLSPRAGVETPKNKLNRSDLVVSTDTVARFEVSLTPTLVGRQTLEAEAGFVLCQDTACRPVKEKLALVVEGTHLAKSPGSDRKVNKKP